MKKTNRCLFFGGSIFSGIWLICIMYRINFKPNSVEQHNFRESEVDNVIKSDQVKPEILIGREPVEANNVIGPEFVLDDECQCRQLKNLPIHSDSTCGRLSTNRGSHQKIFSFSFYLEKSLSTRVDALCSLDSSKNAFLAGIRSNLESIKKFYPGYSMRVFHNAPLNQSCKIRDSLCDLFCQPDQVLDLCNVNNIASFPGLEKSFGMLWRFAPMADSNVEEWHSRDLDAIILQREVDAVQEWSKTDLAFHIMRDNPFHNVDILGGMFGVRQNTPERKAARREEFIKMINHYGDTWSKGRDQAALGLIVAPYAARDSLVHDSYNCKTSLIKGSVSKAWPSQRPMSTDPKVPNFVGNTGDFSITYECPEECRPENHKDWKMC